jgi:transposase
MLRKTRRTEAVRVQLRQPGLPQLVSSAAAFRPSAPLTTPTAATKLALKSITMRYQQLGAEIDALDKPNTSTDVWLRRHRRCWRSKAWAPTSSTLLTIAGDNPERLASEGLLNSPTWSEWAPIAASSGKITRYRLIRRAADREGNRAQYLLAVGRMGWDPATRAEEGGRKR